MLIQHHKKYEELHGEDEIVLMEHGDHKRLHYNLRARGLCNVPPDVLAKISRQAHHRTTKFKIKAKLNGKKYRDLYQTHVRFSDKIAKNIDLREEIGYNEHTGAVYIAAYFYFKKNYPDKRKSLIFTETIGENARLFEQIAINLNTYSITVSSFFVPSNNTQLKEVDEFDAC